ncbi:hypothetical protein A2368_04640 [Candidatus Collierbacteria bacterium RIFOXYB1_FULL_49_13]|uniref:SpoVT-AbrB domain-containing protein n=1 Tax=Candidatus Collierbacteria bacterium RIFOXYB1_FULL_49_13 TaxID=1817728 RepID=A0A1F5FJN5_9BACT|nr:MAG: hypothetical protein A2368_04640 [Candidatus Collierbacteria bacterium RIFOXYB1_FULL_49_13]
MNLNTVATPNTKGQIVIPKKYREKLGIRAGVLVNITLKTGGVFIAPLEKGTATSDSRYLALTILGRTAGAWAGDDWEQLETNKKKVELAAAKERREAW